MSTTETTVTFTCATCGPKTLTLDDFHCPDLDCRGCLAAWGASLRERHFREVVESIRAEIEASNTDPDWIGERPGEIPESVIEAEARERLARADAEFDRGWNEAKEERASW